MQNAKAYVNAAILMHVQENPGNRLIIDFVPSIVIGGIAGSFTHAYNAEVKNEHNFVKYLKQRGT